MTVVKKFRKRARSCSMSRGGKNPPSRTTPSSENGLSAVVDTEFRSCSRSSKWGGKFPGSPLQPNQYRSLNAYRSAISSVHERVDGYEVGQHLLVSRVMKGAFNLHPPQPRYKTTWDVSEVLDYLVTLGPSEALALAWKLTRPSRSADMAKLDLRYRHITPDGVVFLHSGLARAGRPIAPQPLRMHSCAPKWHWRRMRRGQRASASRETWNKQDCSWLW